jgi:hypothetical protein
MEKISIKKFLLLRNKKGEIGFLYPLSGVSDGDYVGFVIITEKETVSQGQECVLDLVEITLQERLDWIELHAVALAKISHDTAQILRQINNLDDLVSTYALGFAPDGLNSNQNAAVGIVKDLEVLKSRQAVSDAIPALAAALDSNEPNLLVNEAHEVWIILHEFWLRYYGGLSDQLEDLCIKIERLFPKEVFT